MGLDVVTATGEILHCSETENSDLLWCARGAGPGKFQSSSRIYVLTSHRIPCNCHAILFENSQKTSGHVSINVHLSNLSVQNRDGLDNQGTLIFFPFFPHLTLLQP